MSEVKASKKVDRVQELPERTTRSGKVVIGEQNITENPRKRRIRKEKKETEKQKDIIIPKAVTRKRKKIERAETAEKPLYERGGARKKLKIQKGSVKDQPEYSTWQGWKEIFLVGMELNQYDETYKIDWDFDHLEEMLEDEDSEINGARYLYLFGSTEPQLVEKHGLSYVPVIVAAVGDVPPPSKVGINSVQMTEEKIIEMSSMKMAWVPFDIDHLSKKDQQHTFMLHCKLRRNQVKFMKEEEARAYEYCLPYFFRPDSLLDDSDNTTEVSVITTIEGRGIMINFDWKSDSLNDTVEATCDDNDLDIDKHGATVKEEIKKEVAKQKKANEEKDAEKKSMLDAIPDKEKEAMNKMKFFKFYPQNKDPSVTEFMSPFINRYYGKAQTVLPPIPEKKNEVESTGFTLLSFPTAGIPKI
ncbi:hypothetical protein AKO1_007701 [Acrasis kona]|uniref:Uncharacterized protein n=1 Tax=Acrasis kona TaxID=1008807 RepID=A0AAW2YS48_9EUKA